MAQPNLLRPITHRLVSTPVQELPQIAYFLASLISTCSQILKSPGGDRGDESIVLVHKLKTRLTSLLQDRSSEGRFTAVVLIKATIECGGHETLTTCEPWVRGLISILNKPDPVSVKKLCILSVTRVFSLTQAFPSLLREITTPLLPSFITASLNLIRPKVVKDKDSESTILSPLLRPVLQCWIHLLSQNPTTFRPFVLRMQTICFSLIADDSTPEQITALANQLLASLHLCAPKNGSTTQWTEMCQDVISAAHKTADRVFRPVLEDWMSSDKTGIPGTNTSAETSYKWSFPELSSMHQGHNKLQALLALLAYLCSCQTTMPVPLPLGSILDLTARLTSVTVPTSSKDSQYAMRYNTETGRDEREKLWTEVPGIHIASLKLLTTLAETFSSAILPVCRNIIEQMTWVFDAGVWHAEVRSATYVLFAALVPVIGSSLTRDDVRSLSGLMQNCCQDQMPSIPSLGSQDRTSERSSKKTQANALNAASVDSFLGPGHKKSAIDIDVVSNGVQRSAHALLPLILTHLSTEVIPQSVRTEMDRTAILTQHKKAMLASVLKPLPTQKGKFGPASIMPFVAHGNRGEMELEALLRPRMPVIHALSQANEVDVDEGEDETFHQSSRATERKGTDLLSQLEDSLERHGTSKPDTHDSIVQPAKSIPGQAPQMFTSLKRDFSSLEQSEAARDQETQLVTNVHPSTTDDFFKKPRLEEASAAPVPDPSNPGLQTDNLALERDDATGMFPGSPSHVKADPFARLPEAQMPDTQSTVSAQNTGTGHEYTDSSDSEIPTIDIEPDTEDEDYMED